MAAGPDLAQNDLYQLADADGRGYSHDAKVIGETLDIVEDAVKQVFGGKSTAQQRKLSGTRVPHAMNMSHRKNSG